MKVPNSLTNEWKRCVHNVQDTHLRPASSLFVLSFKKLDRAYISGVVMACLGMEEFTHRRIVTDTMSQAQKSTAKVDRRSFHVSDSRTISAGSSSHSCSDTVNELCLLFLELLTDTLCNLASIIVV